MISMLSLLSLDLLILGVKLLEIWMFGREGTLRISNGLLETLCCLIVLEVNGREDNTGLDDDDTDDCDEVCDS